MGNTRLYELLAAGELESFLDGRSRKIIVESIHQYISRRLAIDDRLMTSVVKAGRCGGGGHDDERHLRRKRQEASRGRP
jgi:hypothetical protein